MILVGAISGSIAARIMKGDSFGFIVNTLLGIAGALVGGFLFGLLKINAGSGLVKVFKEQFGVSLPENFVGTLIAGIVGAVLILWFSKIIGLGKKNR